MSHYFVHFDSIHVEPAVDWSSFGIVGSGRSGRVELGRSGLTRLSRGIYYQPTSVEPWLQQVALLCRATAPNG
jgi:hypothetical protein